MRAIRQMILIAVLVCMAIPASGQTAPDSAATTQSADSAAAKRFRAIAGGGFLGIPAWSINKTPACAAGTVSGATCTIDPALSTFTAVAGHSLTPVTIEGLVFSLTKNGLIAIGGGFVQAAQKDQDATLLAPAALICVGPGTLQACFGSVLMGTSGVIFPNGGRSIVLPAGTDSSAFIVQNSGAVLPRAFFASFTIGQGF